MRIPLSWLKEYIHLEKEPAEIAKILTQAGLEVDKIEGLHPNIVFDISLTPNLNHCASVKGVARELAALTGLPLHLPSFQVSEGKEPIEEAIKVHLIDKIDCPRYACRLIKNVQVAPSPLWLQERLGQAGVRSVNNVVDAANYVLLEMGHPLHVFDYDLLETKEIVIEKAQEGEKFQTLDGKERILAGSHLTIRDKNRPIALAGIMGGANSEVSNETRHILIESAYFDPISIRKTSKQLNLQTDASRRYERGADPNQVLHSLNRVADLIQKLAGGEILNGTIDLKTHAFPQLNLSCRLSRINRLLGTLISRGEAENIFRALAFQYNWDGQDTFFVQIPSYRVDIREEVDLIEEVARLYGYDHIPRCSSNHPTSTIAPPPLYLFERQIRSYLISAGLQEFVTCNLIGPTILNIVHAENRVPPPNETEIRVLNPTSIEQSILRNSLLPSLLQVAKFNSDHQVQHLSGFEIGRVYFQEGEKYREQLVSGLLLTGDAQPLFWKQTPRQWDFFDLKGIIENLLKELGVEGVFKNLNSPTLHPGRQAAIFIDGLEIGSIGEVHPAIQRRLDVPQRLLFAELNLHDLIQVAHFQTKIDPLPLYPGSERDWTVTIQESLPFLKIAKAIETQDSRLLDQFYLLDIYKSEKFPSGYHNKTFRFFYRDPTKTLSQEEVDQEHARILQNISQTLSEAILK